MSGASIGFSQPRHCSGGKTLRRCRNRRGTDNVVLIDVDSDSFDNVIIIDVPESLQKRFRGSSVLRNDGKGPWAAVICLDDDVGTDDNNAYTGVKVDGNVNNAASSSKSGYPVSGNFASSSNSVADDCHFVRENLSLVNLSKGKRTYSGKGSTKRYGPSADTESGSSDSDYLDCELMEGPFGRLREQWEKASSKRKCDTRNGQAGTKDPEMVFNGAHQNVNLANEHGQPKETAFVDKESKEKEAPSHSIPKGNGNLGCSYSKSKKAVVDNDDLLHSILETRFPDGKADPPCRSDPLTEELPFDNAEHHSGQYFENGTTNTNGHHVNKVQPVQSHSCSMSANEEPVKLVSNSQTEDKRDDLVHGLDGDVMLNSEGCILSGRETLKETDEHKKALEEEWASRQRALQIQAKEAKNLKRLRNRRKAESMRLLDMERRQKQRVEEIRQIQKKDEENMNLKEVIRASVRKELNQLEQTCHDMASLLRGLGILVGVVGQHLSSNEVRLAYKRALLTFHPDRASRSDIRQQVEAEEKFKLISRMKEEFLPT